MVGRKTEPAVCRAYGCGLKECGPVQCARLRAAASVRKSPRMIGLGLVGHRSRGDARSEQPAPPPSSLASAIKIAFPFARSSAPTWRTHRPLRLPRPPQADNNTRKCTEYWLYTISRASYLAAAVDSRHGGLTLPATPKGPEVKFRINNCTPLQGASAVHDLHQVDRVRRHRDAASLKTTLTSFSEGVLVVGSSLYLDSARPRHPLSFKYGRAPHPQGNGILHDPWSSARLLCIERAECYVRLAFSTAPRDFHGQLHSP